MASLGHIAVGLAAARLYQQSCKQRPPLLAAMVGMSALAVLPDADVIAFALGIPYRAPFGHRGAAHSLVAALACGVVCLLACLLACRRSAPAFYTAGFATAVVASHGLLDTLTDGGLGVALLWPLSLHRYFAPWRPIPVAPIGARLLSPYGQHVMLTELLYFLAFLIYAFWPRRRRTSFG
jgi:inner membrane protein